ncbi:tyrosine-protein phosphatase [bacterium]|nr:tyrosine-protein phosphatase [bacterium]
MMKKRLCILALGLLWLSPVWSDPAKEARENEQWTQEVRHFAETQDEAVKHALSMILHDAAALAKLDPHKAHDALQAVLTKIDRARVEPDGAVARERLDAPVGNFGEVVPGRLYRGAQPSPQGLRWLKEQGVGTIVVLREPGKEETNYPNYSRADYLIDIRTLGMEPVELVIQDHTVPSPEQIEKFLQTVEKTSKPCFFHCSAGIGRTGIMAGLYKRQHGASPQEAVDFSKRFLLNPSLVPDHALQASLLANYPLPGRSETLDLPWGIPGQANPLALALARGKSCVIGPDSTVRFDLAAPAPALKQLAEALRRGSFVRLDFRTPQEVDMLASLGRVLPMQHKMGSLPLKELGSAQGLSLADLERARQLLGPVPFEARASGLTSQELTPDKVSKLADLLAGKAEVVDLNLPEGGNPSPEVVKQLAERGLACTVRFTTQAPKTFWDALDLAYLAVSAP